MSLKIVKEIVNKECFGNKNMCYGNYHEAGCPRFSRPSTDWEEREREAFICDSKLKEMLLSYKKGGSDSYDLITICKYFSHAVEEARVIGKHEGMLEAKCGCDTNVAIAEENGREQGRTEERERVRRMIERILKSAQALGFSKCSK